MIGGMLLGRAREREAIDRRLEDARRGRGTALAIVGEPGIGKTALLDDAAERADGMLLLRARGIESEAQVPFAGLLELLRPALGLLDRIPPPQASALAGALALQPARAQDRFAVGAATLSLLAAYAEQGPLAVLVDDVHWLDDSTAGALLFAVRRLAADPVAAILAARAGESLIARRLGAGDAEPGRARPRGGRRPARDARRGSPSSPTSPPASTGPPRGTPRAPGARPRGRGAPGRADDRGPGAHTDAPYRRLPSPSRGAARPHASRARARRDERYR